ncbi:hypothetical protein ACFOW4_02085 [Micromonospora sp. GCM10011542]|uniref:hypothetical protein n=1 Tax=Micromonospora sp. GCM10011542 TaxID=3317337 RepID=UPI00360CBFBA
MSPPAALVRPPRPTIVTVAFWLQLTAVLLLLALIGLVVAEAVHFDGQISRAARLVPDADPAEVRGERQSNVAMTLVLGVPALLLAGWLAVTARPVLRGGNTARILVFVAGGAQLLICLGQCCSGGFLVPLLFAANVPDEEYAEGPAASEDYWQESKFFDTLYSGTDPFDNLFYPAAGLTVFAVLTLTATLVLLLALPPANRYFVPRAETPPVAPVPGAAWPPVLGAAWPPVPGAAWPPVPGAAWPPMPGAAWPPVPPALGTPVPPALGTPGFLPPGQPVPPGFLICPDPAAHLAPAPEVPVTTPDPAVSGEGRPGSTGPSTVPPGIPGGSPGMTGR